MIAGALLFARAHPRLLAAIAAVLLAVAVVTAAHLRGRADGVAEAAPKIAHAQDDAAARRIEAAGERDTAHRVEVVVEQRRLGEATVAALAAGAQRAGDADAPLDPERADRLLRHDLELCRLRPALGGCPGGGPAAEHAASGGAAVRDLPAAEPPDGG